MSKYPHERKLKNGLVDGSAQLRLAVTVIAALVMCFALIGVIIWRFSHLAAAAEGTPVLEINRILLLNEIGTMLITTSSIGLMIICVASFYLCAKFSHRIFGPTVPILRMIHNLEDGNFAHRIHLRKHDELKPIADALNDLAAKLEARDKGG